MDVLPDFKLSEAKARVGTWIADKLHHAMRDAAEQYHWTFVESHRREFIGRGICAGTTYDGGNIADDLRLPRKTADGWRPYNPADFKAYASRQRWFRTPNDAFMTGNFHVAASLLQKVLKLDDLLLVPARARRDLFGRLPPDRRRAGGHGRCGRAQGARRAREVRPGPRPCPAGRRPSTRRPAPPVRWIAVAVSSTRLRRAPLACGEPAVEIGERAHATSRASWRGRAPCL